MSAAQLNERNGERKLESLEQGLKELNEEMQEAERNLARLKNKMTEHEASIQKTKVEVEKAKLVQTTVARSITPSQAKVLKHFAKLIPDSHASQNHRKG